jgi:hypothetical protein
MMMCSMEVLTLDEYAALYAHVTEMLRSCNHSLKNTLSYVRLHHTAKYRKSLELIIFLGGHCDCEVLMNVSPITYGLRFQEEVDTELDVWEWHKIVDNMLYRSGHRPTVRSQSTALQYTLW